MKLDIRSAMTATGNVTHLSRNDNYWALCNVEIDKKRRHREARMCSACMRIWKRRNNLA